MPDKESVSQESNESDTDPRTSQELLDFMTKTQIFTTPSKTHQAADPYSVQSQTEIQRFVAARQWNFRQIIHRTGKLPYKGLEELKKIRLTRMGTPAIPPDWLTDTVDQLEQMLHFAAASQQNIEVTDWRHERFGGSPGLGYDNITSQISLQSDSSHFTSFTEYESPYASLSPAFPQYPAYFVTPSCSQDIHSDETTPGNVQGIYMENPFLDAAESFPPVPPEFMLGSNDTALPGQAVDTVEKPYKPTSFRKRSFHKFNGDSNEEVEAKQETPKRARMADIPVHLNIMTPEERAWDDARPEREKKERVRRRYQKACLPIKVPGYPDGDEGIPDNAWEDGQVELVKNYPNHLHGPVLAKLVELGWDSRRLSQQAGDPTPQGEPKITRNAMQKRIAKLLGNSKTAKRTVSEDVEKREPTSEPGSEPNIPVTYAGGVGAPAGCT